MNTILLLFTTAASLASISTLCLAETPSVPTFSDKPIWVSGSSRSGGDGNAQLLDVDQDGDPDRFVGFNGTPSRLYRNDGIDGFADIAAEVGLLVERSVRPR